MISKNLQNTLKVYAGSLSLILLVSFKSLQVQEGKRIYESKCQRCHGKEGTKTLFGIKSLQKSKMEDADIISIIQSGKKIMPAYKTKLSTEELKHLVIYVKGLRKNS